MEIPLFIVSDDGIQRRIHGIEHIGHDLQYFQEQEETARIKL